MSPTVFPGYSFCQYPSDDSPTSLIFHLSCVSHLQDTHKHARMHAHTHMHTYTHTFTPMFTTMASRRSKTREVTPSPRSLASQQLQRNMYLVPWVGTAKHSSSTSQQLSGEAPSWPSCEVHHSCEDLGRSEKEVFPAQCPLPALCAHPQCFLLIC